MLMTAEATAVGCLPPRVQREKRRRLGQGRGILAFRGCAEDREAAMQIENELSGARRTAQCPVPKEQVSSRGTALRVAGQPTLSRRSCGARGRRKRGRKRLPATRWQQPEAHSCLRGLWIY